MVITRNSVRPGCVSHYLGISYTFKCTFASTALSALNALFDSMALSALENAFCPPQIVHITQSIDVHSYTFTLTGVP